MGSIGFIDWVARFSNKLKQRLRRHSWEDRGNEYILDASTRKGFQWATVLRKTGVKTDTLFKVAILLDAATKKANRILGFVFTGFEYKSKETMF